MHLVVRLDDEMLRIDGAPAFRQGAVAGLRTAAYTKTSAPGAIVGASIRPGMCAALLGIPAVEFAGRHVALDDIWPTSRLERLRDRLAAARDANEMTDIFEAALIHIVQPTVPPAMIAASLAALGQGQRVAAIAGASEVSHRHFIHRFREDVGIAPVQFRGLVRFERLLLGLDTPDAMAGRAVAAGYADQAHMARDFRRFTGLSLSTYRTRVGAHPRHVPGDV